MQNQKVLYVTKRVKQRNTTRNTELNLYLLQDESIRLDITTHEDLCEETEELINKIEK